MQIGAISGRQIVRRVSVEGVGKLPSAFHIMGSPDFFKMGSTISRRCVGFSAAQNLSQVRKKGVRLQFDNAVRSALCVDHSFWMGK